MIIVRNRKIQLDVYQMQQLFFLIIKKRDDFKAQGNNNKTHHLWKLIIQW